jgi:WD40 repeat protein
MLLRGNITEPYARSNKVLSYNRRKPYKGDFLMDTWSENEPEIESVRKINKQPYKILDAPKLKDDFYNNLLDWNKDDLIAISLGNIAYVWSGRSNEAEKLAEGRISCVKWAQKLLAIGD